MPTPAFGFSVGDFVTGIGALIKISKALKKTGGAASEYQDVIAELDALVAILQRLQALHSSRSNLAPGNAIWALASQCQQPIQAFLKRIEKYEKHLGEPSLSSLSGVPRKAKWALIVRDEVKDLRAGIGPQLTSISLLLGIELMDSQTLVQFQNTSIETLIQGQSHVNQVGFAQLNDKIEQLSLRDLPDHQSALKSLSDQFVAGHDEVRRLSQQSLEATRSVIDILSNIDRTSHIVEHTLERCAPPPEFFTASKRHTSHEHGGPWTNVTMLIEVSSIPTFASIELLRGSISLLPRMLLSDSIVFEDVLGRSRSIPYGFFREFFLDWQVFQAFLASQFRDLPGYQKVLRGQFHLLLDKRNTVIIDKNRWATSVLPGMRIVMSVVVEDLLMQEGVCPRLQCRAKNRRNESQQSITCNACGMTYFPSDVEEMRRRTFPTLGNFSYSHTRPSTVMDPISSSLHKPPHINQEIDSVQIRTMTEREDSSRTTEKDQSKQDEIEFFKRVHISSQGIRLSSRTLCTLFGVSTDNSDWLESPLPSISIFSPSQGRWFVVRAMMDLKSQTNFISLDIVQDDHFRSPSFRKKKPFIQDAASQSIYMSSDRSGQDSQSSYAILRSNELFPWVQDGPSPWVKDEPSPWVRDGLQPSAAGQTFITARGTEIEAVGEISIWCKSVRCRQKDDFEFVSKFSVIDLKYVFDESETFDLILGWRSLVYIMRNR
ncbi:MAG: hypothetical protein M1836_001551 [Candelina mexicana]|nr:MAG: hypothetical protein M1836_001551 [Candelina mexicana]